MKCPKCDREVNKGVKFCPGCGNEMPAAPQGAIQKKRPIRKAPSKKPESEYLKKKQAERAKAAARQMWIVFVTIIIGAVVFYFLFVGIDAYRVEKAFKTCELERRTGNYKEGIEKCKYVVDKKPRHKKAWLELARCHMGTDMTIGDEAYRRVLEETKNALDWVETPEIYSIRGQAFYFLGSLDKAAEALEKALALDSGNRLAHQYLGYILSEQDKREPAIEHLILSLKDASRVEQREINEEIGDLYYRSAQFKEAIDYYHAVQESDYNELNVCIKLAKSFVGAKELGKGIQEASRCKQINPEDVTAEKLQQKITAYKDRLDTIFFISERKSVDDMFVLIYSAFLSHIEKINNDPGAFIGQEDLALEEMIQDAKALYNNYSALSAPAEYYHIHTFTLTASTTLIDTMNRLKKYLARAEPETLKGLTRQLDALNRAYAKLREMWDNESRQLNIEDMMNEAKKIRNATGSEAIPFPIEIEKPGAATGTEELPKDDIVEETE